MEKEYKVPAVEKTIRIFDLFLRQRRPMSASEISKELGYYVGTVHSILHDLTKSNLLKIDNKKYYLGPKIYELGQHADKDTSLIGLLHPYLEEINAATGMTCYLSIRSGLQSIAIDRADSAKGLKIMQDLGARMSIVSGVQGKALMSQLPDQEIDDILANIELKKYTRYTCTDKKKFKEIILKVHKEGLALSKEERVLGVCAVAVPLSIKRSHEPLAIWVHGLKAQFQKKGYPYFIKLFKGVAKRIDTELS